jgi:hypothetical protein
MPARKNLDTLKRLMSEAKQLKERTDLLTRELEQLLTSGDVAERPERRKRPRD